MSKAASAEIPVTVRLGQGVEPPYLEAHRLGEVRATAERTFDPDEYAGRVSRTRSEMESRGLDGILVFRPSSVEWLCGYYSVEPLPQPLLVTADYAGLYVPDPELGRGIASTEGVELLHMSPTEDALAVIAADVIARVAGGERIGLEPRATTTPPRMADLLREGGLEPHDSEFMVETLRMVLSAAELRCVERAAEISTGALSSALEAAGREGATDSEVAAAIAAALYGPATSPAPWGPIVASGWRGGVAHSTWEAVPLARGKTTFLEYSGSHHRYVAPVMRTISLGEPDANARRLEKLAQTMIGTILETLRPGITADEVARGVENAIGELPPTDAFHYNFGYPAGLAHPPHWMDGAPSYLVKGNPLVIEAGMAFHCPASFRSFGEQGLGLSHTVVVEERGARAVTGGELAIQVL